MTPESDARTRLYSMHYMHGIKDALRMLVDGLGSSTYRKDDPICRMAQDVGSLATHSHGGDCDIIMDRHARCLLGLPMEDTDRGTLLD